MEANEVASKNDDHPNSHSSHGQQVQSKWWKFW